MKFNAVPKHCIAILLLILMPVKQVYAEDVDLLSPYQKGAEGEPNLLFLVDNSNSMKIDRRILMSRAFSRLMGNERLQRMRIGLSFFGGGRAKDKHESQLGIMMPLSNASASALQVMQQNPAFTNLSGDNLPDPTSSETVSEYLNHLVQGMADANHRTFAGTPSADALFEASSYFYGAAGLQTQYSPADFQASHPSTYEGGPASNSGELFNYRSPVTEACQPNNIVFLTDGAAYNNNVPTEIADFIGPAYAQNCDSESYEEAVAREPEYIGLGERFDAMRCTMELAEFLANNDMHNSGTEWLGEQTVKTHTIGFRTRKALAQQWLSGVAKKGGGLHFNVDNEDSLVDALEQIVNSQPSGDARSFSNIVYDKTSGLAVDNDQYAYVPLFKRKASSPVWEGNLKKFKVQGAQLLGEADEVANQGDADVGESNDLWTNGEHSGVVAQLVDHPPKVLTDTGVNQQRLVEINADNISRKDLGDASMSRGQQDALLDVLNGIERKNGKTSFIARMGAIIHSQPKLVHYAGGKKLLFFGTNDGYFRAVDAATGQTLFMYMPREFINKGYAQYLQANARGEKHRYGVDGTPSFLHVDSNNNGTIDTGEKAMVYFGTRRSSQAYYALDINYDAMFASPTPEPTLAFKVKPNASQCNGPCYKHLAYSWATPKVGWLMPKINADELQQDEENERQAFLFIAAGYHSFKDSSQRLAVQSRHVGSGVYVVNALTGDQVAYINTAGETGSSPSPVKLVDLDADGLVDRLYWSTTTGNIHRYDMSDNIDLTKVGQKLKSMRLARLAQPGMGEAGQRSFFVEPEVGLHYQDGLLRVSLAIGSGNRAQSKKIRVNNRFYVLHDLVAQGTDAKLVKPISTEDLSFISDQQGAAAAAIRQAGWQMDLALHRGEKVLSKALIFSSKVLFNSINVAVPEDKCKPMIMMNRSYAVNLMDGRAFTNLDNDSSGAKDSHVEWLSGDIAGEPQLLFNKATATDGSPCGLEDCNQTVSVHVGRSSNPLLDIGNAKETTDITSIQGWVKFWIHKVFD